MSKNFWKVLAIIATIGLLIVGLMWLRKYNHDHEIATNNMMKKEYPRAEMSLQGNDMVNTSGMNIVIANNTVYTLELPVDKSFRIDVLTGSLIVDGDSIANWEYGGLFGEVISTISQEIVTPSGEKKQEAKTCLIVWDIKDETCITVKAHRENRKYQISIRNLNTYGNPIFNWEMK